MTIVLRPFLQLQKAEAELAYELQAAKTKQRIKEENMQIKASVLTKKTTMVISC